MHDIAMDPAGAPTHAATPPPPPPPPPPALHAALAEPAVEHGIEFTASAAEYFRIWIVNLALSLLTLGIYSAWAKVRTQRYFYGNTRLAGATFAYSADPIAILKGRIIAAVLFGTYLVTAHFAPLVNLGVLALIGVLMPWIVVRSLRFRARYSAWRGLSFRFGGRDGQAYGLFLGLPILAVFTAGLLFPYVKAMQQRFVAENHHFGGEAARFEMRTGDYYVAYLVAVGIMFAAMMGIVFLSVGAAMASQGAVLDERGASSALLVAMVVLIYLVYFGVFVFLRVSITNLFWNNVSLGPNRFRCTLRTLPLFWIYLVNVLAIVASLGLLVPWAMVRTARYRARNFTLLAQGDLDAFCAEAGQSQRAVGAEMGDFFDVDIGW